MGLLDVNALVALAWDSHVHHSVIRNWMRTNATSGWATCPVTESGFVRVSSNPRVLPHPIGVSDARAVLRGLCAAGAHSFLSDSVSQTDEDLPAIRGYRQVTDGHLLALAQRHGVRLVTFDTGFAELADANDVELLALI